MHKCYKLAFYENSPFFSQGWAIKIIFQQELYISIEHIIFFWSLVSQIAI